MRHIASLATLSLEESTLLQRFIAAALICAVTVFSVAGPVRAASTETVLAQAQPSPGTISGRVIDARAVAVTGATVIVDGPSGRRTTTTDAQGAFSVPATGGTYRIVVNRGGYQTAETDATLPDGGSAVVAVTLADASLSSLRVIGRTTSNRGATFNTSTSSVAVLPATTLVERVNPKTNYIAAELPGVTFNQSNSTPNGQLVVRGGLTETRVQIDGHPVSSGVSGTYNTAYISATAFGSVEVTKGPGLFGPNAGESAFGTINLRTPDFTARNTADVYQGFDSNAGMYTIAKASGNFLNNRLSLLAGKTIFGTNGPQLNNLGYRTTGTTPGGYTLPAGSTLVNFVGTLSSNNNVNSELFKARYRFSDRTSLALTFFGLHGSQAPQGGAYATYYGQAAIAPCATAKGETGCGAYSLYNNPQVQNQIGSIVASSSNWFPNSVVRYNQPNWTAEFNTALGKNDTFTVRPYVGIINRFIDGTLEAQKPGNVQSLNGGAAWYLAVAPGQCASTFQPASVGASKPATGPCFIGGTSPDQQTPLTSPAAAGAAGCATATVPTATSCYIAYNLQNNTGGLSYAAPFNTFEFDRLHGVTLSYVHPFGPHVLNVAYDYVSDDTLNLVGDTEIPIGGTYTSGGNYNVPAELVGKPVFENLGPASAFPGATSLNTPPTFVRTRDLSITGQFALSPQLTLGIGNYFTNWNARIQVENPAVLANVAATYPQYVKGPTANGTFLSDLTPLSLIASTRTASHYDPHVGLTYRPNRDIILRASAGSSVTVPYASQLSGTQQINTSSGTLAGALQFTIKNPNLQPETTVAYDLGTDIRLADGGVLSADLYNNTVFGAFANSFSPYTGGGFTVPVYTSTTVNASQLRDYGLEITLSKTPSLGWGYRLTGTFQRAFYANLDPAIYGAGLIGPTGAPASFSSTLVNYKQLDSPFIPFAKGYGELRYAGLKGTLVTLGATYTGANNTYDAPNGFVTYNSTLRIPVGSLAAQLSVDNLGNYNFANGYPAQFNGGNSRLNFNPATGFGSISNNIQNLPPRTFRLQISKHFE